MNPGAGETGALGQRRRDADAAFCFIGVAGDVAAIVPGLLEEPVLAAVKK